MIIGIYSPYPHSGKSTVKDFLIQIDRENGNRFNFKHGSFAAKVKESLALLFENADFDITPYLYGNMKSELIPGLNVTGGQLMSRYAMWWRSEDSNIWVDLFINNNNVVFSNYVVDDMRFENEYLESSFDIIIYRPSVLEHNREPSSEGQLDTQQFDFTIINDGNLDDLYKKVQDVYDSLIEY